MTVKGQVCPTRNGTSPERRHPFADGEYCQYQYHNEPLFRTVGNDSTFYRPPTANQLLRYLNQIPEDFEMCCKVWEEITIPRFASHVRYGVKAGQPNPRFLDANLFNEMVLTPYRDAKFQPHAGPFLFEFQRHDLPRGEFCSRLAGFFDQLPREFRYAVEIRNPALLGPQYQQVLERYGVAQSTTIGRTCHRSWNNMRAWMALPHLLRC